MHVCMSAALFCARIYLWVFFFVFLSWLSKQLLSVTQYAHNSLVAMNTAWARLYCSGLANVCALLVFQCCGAELGRRSSGNRYRRDHLWHMIITSHRVFVGKTCCDDWLLQITLPSMLRSLFSKACSKNDTPQVPDSVFGPDDNWVWSVQYSTSANRISWVIGFLCRFIDHPNLRVRSNDLQLRVQPLPH